MQMALENDGGETENKKGDKKRTKEARESSYLIGSTLAMVMLNCSYASMTRRKDKGHHGNQNVGVGKQITA